MNKDPGYFDENALPEWKASLRGGNVVVATASGSTYLIDLDEMTLVRVQETPDQQCAEMEWRALRRDGEPIRILRLCRLEIGHRAEFDLEPLGDRTQIAFTHRSTTAVLSIKPVF